MGIHFLHQVQTYERKKWLNLSFHQVMEIHQKRKSTQELCPLTIRQWLKLWMKLSIHPTATTRNLFQFLSPMQVSTIPYNSHPDSTVQTPKQPSSPVIPLPPPVSPNTLCNFRNNLSQRPNNLIQLCTPLIQTTFTSPPSPQLSHPSNELSPPLSPTPLLPPLDLTPPTQNTSESDISNNFSDPNYNNTDDDYGIPFERPPARPMVNYQKDRELEEDYEIGWEWL